MLIALVTLAAQAQDVPQLNGQLFRPSADARATLWTEDTHRSPDGYASARSFVQYARAPVRWTGADGETDLLVSDLLAVDVLGAYHYRGLRLGVHMPLYGVAAGAGSPTQPGLGDLALDLKGTLLDGGENAVGIALLGRLTLPTASVSAPLGAGATGWEIAGIVDKQWDAWTVAANVGTRGVPRATYEDLVWNDQVFGRLGVGYAFTPDVGISGDLGLQTNWASGRNPAGTAAELMGGGWTRVTPDFVVRGGVSTGLTRAPGAPAMRALVGIAWEPDPSPDLDVDGIVDRDDWCPGEPEDFDGFEDSDGCHDPQVTMRVDLVDDAGERLERGTVVLQGPERHRVDLADPFVTLHPGVYELTATATGFDTTVREISVPAEQGFKLQQPMVARTASLTVFAVDELGEPVPAELVVGDALPVPVDGGPLELPVGEHALVIRAEGFRAHAASVTLERGADRQLSVVLEPLAGEESDGDELVRAGTDQD